MSNMVLEADGLHAGYGAVEVLRGVSLHVSAGEMVAILGANGAGKTTTLMVLSGALPYSGRVAAMGASAVEPTHRRVRRGMQFLPEERGIIRTLNVRDNLRLGRANLDDALALSPELEPLLNRKAGNLSGGEQQILALTRALATSPRLLLADELSFGLAPKIVSRMLGLVRAAANNGAGVLIVEQYARQALAHSDRAYVMRQGEIVLEGSASDLAADIDTIESSYLRASGQQPS